MLATTRQMRRYIAACIGAMLVLSATLLSAADALIEKDGVVVGEVEMQTAIGGWSSKTALSGYTGTSYYEWTGSNHFGSGGTDTLTFKVQIQSAGNYQILVHNRICDESHGTTEANDAWVRMSGTPISGQYTIGTNQWTKFYNNYLGWRYCTSTKDHDPQAIRQYFSAGEHTIEFSGRSTGHGIDRFVLFKYEEKPYDVDDKGNRNTSQDAALNALPVSQVGGTGNLTTTTMPAINFPYAGTSFYKDGNWLGIDPGTNPAVLNSAEVSQAFPGTSGTYDVTLKCVGENDGRSTYRLYKNNVLVGELLCPLSTQTFEEGPAYNKTWTGLTVNAGDTIKVWAQCGTDGTEFSRARWVGVDFVPEGTTPPPGTTGTVSGELKKWHKVSVSFEGPSTSETATPNPFTDYRLDVTFTNGSTTYTVPGYYAADGNAANTGATAGNIWLVHFAPDKTGTWTYSASFTTGSNVAQNGGGASAGYFDGATGTFVIAATDKTGRDLRGKGRLKYVGKHHLRFAEDGEYFLKVGADAPENFLAYSDFDGDFKTDGQGDSLIKDWSAHTGDWTTGDPTWAGGKGKGIIGAVNYLSGKGMNVFSFLTMNINGDDKNVFPYLTYNERYRMDVSRLAQWEVVLEHGTKKGMYLHFKTQETENETLLDGGALGNERKLYYRELIARFGHHLALNWNLGEESNDQNDTQRKDMAQFFHDLDPYDHNIVIHTYPNAQEAIYRPMLGSLSQLTGVSIQIDKSSVHAETKQWVNESAAAGKPWVVANDEQGSAGDGVVPDANDYNHDVVRKDVLWGNIMAGGAGVEYYFGYSYAHSDLTCQDYRSRDHMWDLSRYALEFFRNNNVPFWDMKNDNGKSSNGADYCFYKAGEVYVVYLKNGGTTDLDLSGVSGSFTVKWFDPRNGGALQYGSVTSVAGGEWRGLGTAPDNVSSDWVILVSSPTAGNIPPIADAQADSGSVAVSTQVTLSGSGSSDPDNGPQVLTYSWTQDPANPAVVTLTDTAGDNMEVTFSTTMTGSYTFTLTVDDGADTDADSVTVVVSATGTTDHLSVQCSATFTEEAGTATCTVTLSRTLALGENLVVNLSSSDTSEIEVPASVTMIGGSNSVSFNINVKDDALVDGDQTVTITASATGATAGTRMVTVTDNDTITIGGGGSGSRVGSVDYSAGDAGCALGAGGSVSWLLPLLLSLLAIRGAREQ